MPRAGDAFLNGGLNATHSPLQRIGYQATKKTLSFDDILQQIEDFVTTYLFPAIKSLTGIDLTTLLPLLNAFKAFMDGITGVLSGNPTAFLGALSSIFGGGPTAWFGDLLGLFGNPLGLGTGSPTVPSLSNIPNTGWERLHQPVLTVQQPVVDDIPGLVQPSDRTIHRAGHRNPIPHQRCGRRNVEPAVDADFLPNGDRVDRNDGELERINSLIEFHQPDQRGCGWFG
jgi:hypothetical protein